MLLGPCPCGATSTRFLWCCHSPGSRGQAGRFTGSFALGWLWETGLELSAGSAHPAAPPEPCFGTGSSFSSSAQGFASAPRIAPTPLPVPACPHRLRVLKSPPSCEPGLRHGAGAVRASWVAVHRQTGCRGHHLHDFCCGAQVQLCEAGLELLGARAADTSLLGHDPPPSALQASSHEQGIPPWFFLFLPLQKRRNKVEEIRRSVALGQDILSSIVQPSAARVPLGVRPLHDSGSAAGTVGHSTPSCQALGLPSHCPGS